MSREPLLERLRFAHLLELAEGLPGVEVVRHGAEAVGAGADHGIEALAERVGGPARFRVVVLLAAVLGLSGADTGSISAIAPQLERSLAIGNVQLGLLVTVSGLTAAAAMLPIGWATDRSPRVRLVTGAAVLWAVAELLSAAAPDYTFLLVVRVALGGLTAVTGPTLASLTGDLFPARERARIYGYILTGELLGAGAGLLVAGLFSSWFSWRVALGVLALPSALLAWQLHRRLPEPARGGQSRLPRGAVEIVGADDVDPAAPAASDAPGRDGTAVVDEVRRRGIDPRQGTVPRRDPRTLGGWDSLRYVLAVRSNVMLIVSSALGYFFFGGVETFALVYLEGHYGVSQSEATLMALVVGAAAVVGAVAGGRLTDRLLHHHRVDARLAVPAVAFAVAVGVFVPAVLVTSALVALPLFMVAGMAIAVPNPGLDAARLDVMPSRMWGRAEAVRSLLRSVLQSLAPLVFGVVSIGFGGHDRGFAVNGGGTHVSGGHSQAVAASQATGLEQTILIMLVALLAAAVVVWRGRRRYPVDVAAAAETEARFPPCGPADPASPRPAVTVSPADAAAPG